VGGCGACGVPPARLKGQGPEAKGMAAAAAASAPAATSRARPLRLVGATMMVLSTTAVGVEVFLPGGLASLAAGNPPIGDKQGYWGHKTMNVQPPWCEADYHVTHYVAEFWNSLTSVTIILYGLWGIMRHHRSSHGLEPRFWAAFGALYAPARPPARPPASMPA
jgi:hypothetical protein